jgi:hypothetical protein
VHGAGIAWGVLQSGSVGGEAGVKCGRSRPCDCAPRCVGSHGGGSEGSDSTPEICEKYEQRKKKEEDLRQRTISTTVRHRR